MTSDDPDQLRQKVATLEAANAALREEYGRAASQHAQVAGLLAACHRLHASLDRRAVLTALEDTLTSLVGCEEAAVYELAGEPSRLTLVGALGMATAAVPPLPEMVLPAMVAGRLFIAAPYNADPPPRPSACFPLRVDGRVIGAIAFFRLADGRLGLTNDEWGLLDVIGMHAATALLATRRASDRP
jgi:GAF domain-containing protein